MRDRYFDFIQRHPWLILALSTLFIVATSAGVTRLSFTSDLRAYFSDQNPQLQAFEDMEHRFSKQDSLLFLVSSETQDLFSRRPALVRQVHRVWLTDLSVVIGVRHIPLKAKAPGVKPREVSICDGVRDPQIV